MESGIKNAFRFYSDKSMQNRYFDYVGGNLRTWKLNTDVYRLLPFQIQVALNTEASDVVVKLCEALDDSETDISSYFVAGTDLFTADFTSYTYLIYRRNQNLQTELIKGTYYLKVTVGATSYYSEVFNVVDPTGMIIIDYYHSSDIGTIHYNNSGDQYTNKLIVDTKLNRPEYEYEEEGIEDGDVNFIPTFQRLVKKYKFIFYAPEYVVDAVSLIPFHDSITIYTDYAESSIEQLNVLNFYVDSVEWNETKGFAKVTCSFRTGATIVTPHANNIT